MSDAMFTAAKDKHVFDSFNEPKWMELALSTEFSQCGKFSKLDAENISTECNCADSNSLDDPRIAGCLHHKNIFIASLMFTRVICENIRLIQPPYTYQITKINYWL